MKKNIFSILIPLLSMALSFALSALLFSACSANTSSSEEEEAEEYLDVVYSKDWKYVSIYLDGSSDPISIKADKKPAPAQTRAMTANTARKGFDYFEVFFYYKGTVARAAWELGKRASIMDVYRTDPGIDYSLTSLKTTAGGGGGSIPKEINASVLTNPSASILFAGRKEGKTLLAVGKLVSVDTEEPVDPQLRTTLVSTGTNFVTFELFAVTGNTSLKAAESSFLTGGASTAAAAAPSADNTKVVPVRIGGREFPLYVLPGGKNNIEAQYSLGIDGNWNDFNGSIFVMREGTASKRQARYPAGSGKYWYASYPEDLTTVVRMTNNQSSWVSPKVNKDAAALELQNPVTFSIDTSKTTENKKENNGIFTFYFEIPVYAIHPGIPKNEFDHWNIRPAYASYYLNIDSGIIIKERIDEATGEIIIETNEGEFSDRNIGGAVLCGVDFPAEKKFEIPAEKR